MLPDGPIDRVEYAVRYTLADRPDFDPTIVATPDRAQAQRWADQANGEATGSGVVVVADVVTRHVVIPAWEPVP